jgi:fermentation-respiration switch protein FrsA (DUF1100 family)
MAQLLARTFSLSVPIVMVSGILNRLVPPYVAYDYARAMQRKHAMPIELVDIPGAGHFDLVTPGTRAWEEVRARIAAALRTARWQWRPIAGEPESF